MLSLVFHEYEERTLMGSGFFGKGSFRPLKTRLMQFKKPFHKFVIFIKYLNKHCANDAPLKRARISWIPQRPLMREIPPEFD